MLDQDAEGVCLLVKEHFSKATQADARLCWEVVKGYSRQDAEQAVREHRLEKGAAAWRPDPRRIGALAAKFYNERMPRRLEERAVDVIRKFDPLTYDGMDAVTILQHHFSEAWERVKETADTDRGRNGMRAMILGHARSAFRQEGLADAGADTEARACVELNPGERIILPSLLKSPEKGGGSSSWEQLQKLAVADHAEREEQAAATTVTMPPLMNDLDFDEEPVSFVS